MDRKLASSLEQKQTLTTCCLAVPLRQILSVLQSVHAVLEEASQSCNQWTQLSESVEQRVTGLHNSIEVLRVTALAERQKGEASKPALVVLERTLADLQAQLAGEKTSHQLTQVLIPSTTTRLECQCKYIHPLIDGLIVCLFD